VARSGSAQPTNRSRASAPGELGASAIGEVFELLAQVFKLVCGRPFGQLQLVEARKRMLDLFRVRLRELSLNPGLVVTAHFLPVIAEGYLARHPPPNLPVLVLNRDRAIEGVVTGLVKEGPPFSLGLLEQSFQPGIGDHDRASAASQAWTPASTASNRRRRWGAGLRVIHLELGETSGQLAKATDRNERIITQQKKLPKF